MLDFEWEEFMEISHMASKNALNWLISHGVDLNDCDCGDGVSLEDVDLDKDFTLFIGGFWSDLAPTIEFENGHVARWYRSEAWD